MRTFFTPNALEEKGGNILEKNNKPVKSTWKDRNSPMIGENGLIVEEGDNRKYLKVSMKLMTLPDIDLHDKEQVMERLNEYFQIYADADMKPTVAGMGLALNGMDRRRLWEIKTDSPSTYTIVNTMPSDVKDCIKKAYKLLENMMENYMQNGKINPVAGIFLSKNNFGYVDKVEHVVTPNTKQDEEYDIDEIRNRRITGE
jgi:Fe-S cluster biosynthesis and repair protein YggX